MKKIIFYSLLFSFFISCEKKKDPNPTPILQEFVEEVTYSSEIYINTYSLIFSDNKLNNLQETIRSFKKDGSLLSMSKPINNILTEEVFENYKKISDVINMVNGVYVSTNNNATYSARRIPNGYEISVTYININSDLITHYYNIELNANNQITKHINVKSLSTGLNGVKKEILYNSYTRFEYDTRGNIVRRFFYDGSSIEALTDEYTYDDKPNPLKVLQWFNRLSEFITVSSESTNNILTTKTIFTPRLETTTIYTYDMQTKYPLKSISVVRNLSTGIILPIPENIKTTYKY